MPELLTPQDVAKRLKIVVKTVYEYISNREFPNVIRISGQYRIPETDVAMLERRSRVFDGTPDASPAPRRRVISKGV